MATKSDNFLSDIHKPKLKNLTYSDGLRFGFGFAVANLIILIVISGLGWLAITYLHLH